MRHSKTLVGIIVLGMSLAAGGCATKASVSSAKLCTAHKGVWDSAKATCNGLAAQTICESADGSWNPQPRNCEF